MGWDGGGGGGEVVQVDRKQCLIKAHVWTQLQEKMQLLTK